MVAQRSACLAHVIAAGPALTDSVLSVSPASALEGDGLPGLSPYPFLGPMLLVLCMVGVTYLAVERWRVFRARRNRAAGKQKQELSPYDPLTGLPSRRLLLSLLGQAVSRATRTGRTVALLVVELDYFKVATEARGHATSNALIRAQAARLKNALRSTDAIARLRGDRFAVVLENLASATDVLPIAQKMQETVALPMTLEGHEMFLSSRIGVALYPNDAGDRDGVLEQAIRALATAKSQGQPIYFSLFDVGPAPVPHQIFAPAWQEVSSQSPRSFL